MKQILLALFLIALPVSVFTLAFQFLGPQSTPSPGADLGDLSGFSAIVSDVQSLVSTGDAVAASRRITDLETAWDNAEDSMRPLNQAAWSKIDTAIDEALDEIRTPKPNATAVNKALANLTKTLASPYDNVDSDVAGGGARMVAGVAVTDATGYPLACEGMLRKLSAAMDAGKIPKNSLVEAGELRDKAIERCNADDDRRADEFVARALSLAGAP